MNVASYQSKIRLVDQRRGLQCLSRVGAIESMMRQFTKLLVDQRQQFLARFAVAAFNRPNDTSDFTPESKGPPIYFRIPLSDGLGLFPELSRKSGWDATRPMNHPPFGSLWEGRHPDE